LPNHYFFSPNQFWVHKNHIVLLKAIKLLKDKGTYINIVFSGKEFDFRNKEYTNDLKQYVVENDLQNQVVFLGFIDRKEQLKIMENSLAVIQPSKFEGWSSVIEDCKLIGKYVFASSLPVHLEQIKNNVEFFDADNFEELSQKLNSFLINPKSVSKLNYIENQVNFGEKFYEMLESIKSTY
jgi:glycosyltransferase involved in cell wall biosynthesis